MKIELNRKVIEHLQGIAVLIENKHAVPTTAYFPFIVCFEWVDENGELVKQSIQRRRAKLCEAYNLYLQDGEAGSFEQVKICLKNFLHTLGE